MSWTNKPVGEILSLNYGKSLPDRLRQPGKVPVFGSNGVVGYHTTPLIPGEGIIVGRKGSAGEIHFSEVPFFPIDTTFYIATEDTRLNLRYLSFALEHLNFKRILGDVGVPGLNREMAYREYLTYPVDEAEQRQIARVLAAVQRAIEIQQAIIANTRKLKCSLMHKLFTEGLRSEAQKRTEIGLVPESWEVKPLYLIGDVIYGIQAAVANKFAEDETPIFTNKNIDLEGRLDLTEVNSFKLESPRHFATRLQYGDVLFCWRSGSKEHVGKTAYFDLDGEFTHSSFLLRIRPPSQIVGRYLFLLLNHLRQDGYFVRMQNYAVNAKFNKSAIEQLPVAIPSNEDEMQDIVDTLDCIMAKLELAQGKLDRYQDLFNTLLHQLMSAQLRVNELDLDSLGVPALD